MTSVRFESEATARSNSERAEQDAWWAETEKCFDGPVTFAESSDVTEWLGGGSDDAGFVQVTKFSGCNRAELEALDEEMSTVAGEHRPDLIGGYQAWTGPDSCVEVAYFTSEAAARAGESAAPPPELGELMERMQSASGEVEYLDLADPNLR